jgi:hypothetical protein
VFTSSTPPASEAVALVESKKKLYAETSTSGFSSADRSPTPSFAKHGLKMCQLLDGTWSTEIDGTICSPDDVEPTTIMRVYAHKPSFLSPAHGLFQTSMREQMLGYWYSAYQSETFSGQRHWLPDVPGFTQNLRVVESSAYALCLAGLGRKFGDPALVKESLGLYTRGLVDLQKALYDPQAMYSDETLAACMLLTMYEIIECPDQSQRAFLSHYNGVAKLVQLRGPKAHVEGLGHSVFLHFRSLAVRSPLPQFRFSSS